MIIDCIGCLHGHYPKLDGGGLLIVTGDLTARDTQGEYLKFFMWLTYQPYEKIVLVAGNHDNEIQKRYVKFDPNGKITYLEDSGTEFEGLKIWGMPWSLTFPGMNPKCKAFTFDTEEEMIDKVDMIPHDVDILITHMPAYGVLDKINSGFVHRSGSVLHAGSGHLYGYLKYACRPKLHVHSHIHEAYGQLEHFSGCISVNCSIMNEHYQAVNKPIRIEI